MSLLCAVYLLTGENIMIFVHAHSRAARHDPNATQQIKLARHRSAEH